MDDLLLQAPHSVAAEQAVLGSMLVDPHCIPDVLARLTPEDFYLRPNREIFRAMSDMFQASIPVDFVTVLDALRTGGGYDEQSSRDCIVQLVDATPSASNVRRHVAIVRERAALRSAQEAANEIALMVSNGAPLTEIQAALQAAQEATGARETVEAVGLSDATIRLYDELGERVKRGGGITGIPTGIDKFDELTGGLHPGNMVVLAARSGMGKSALALNIAVEAARHVGVLFFSLEMTATELTERAYSAQADVDFTGLRNARLSDGDWAKMAAAVEGVTALNLRIVEAPALDMDAITLMCRRAKPALVVIDHIGWVTPTGKHRDRREAMDGVSRRIKCLAKSLNIPVLAVAQLNREITRRTNKTPILSDLRESGSIEQDADVVAFVDRPAYYDKEQDKNTASLIVAKNRHGQADTVPLLWFGSRQKFSNDWTKEDSHDDRSDN